MGPARPFCLSELNWYFHDLKRSQLYILLRNVAAHKVTIYINNFNCCIPTSLIWRFRPAVWASPIGITLEFYPRLYTVIADWYQQFTKHFSQYFLVSPQSWPFYFWTSQQILIYSLSDDKTFDGSASGNTSACYPSLTSVCSLGWQTTNSGLQLLSFNLSVSPTQWHQHKARTRAPSPISPHIHHANTRPRHPSPSQPPSHQ